MPRKSKTISPEATSDDSMPTPNATEEVTEVNKPVRKNMKEDALRTSDLRKLIEEIVLENLSRLKIIYI